MGADHRIYLLDTNILSDMMRFPEGLAATHFLQVARENPSARFCTSVIVQCELLVGIRRRTDSRWQSRYERVLDSVDVLPLEPDVCSHYAALRNALESAGTPIGPNDMLIAAHALSAEALLVSADAEFLRVPGLRLENWLAPSSRVNAPNTSNIAS